MTRRLYSYRNRPGKKPLVIGVVAGFVVLLIIVLCVRGLLQHPDQIDQKTVLGAFNTTVRAHLSGNYKVIYSMLVPEQRAKVDETYANIRHAREVIEQSYPPFMRPQALEALGPKKLREAPDAATWLAERMGHGKPPADSTDSLAFRVKKVEEKPENSGHFIVHTLSGATIEFVCGGDSLFYLILDPRDQQILQEEYVKSIEALDAALKAARTFGKLSTGPRPKTGAR